MPAPRRDTNARPDPTIVGKVQLAQVLQNLATELAASSELCVRIEEAIWNRFRDGGRGDPVMPTELQNLDRLIQMLTDFSGLAARLSETVQGQTIDRQGLAARLVMAESRERLLACYPAQPRKSPDGGITLF